MSADEVHRFEEMTLNSSSALKQMIYDGWVLRFSPGSNVKRANSVTALYPSTQPIDEKLTFCESAYAREALHPLFRVNEFSNPYDLDRRLASRGYEKIDPTVLMALSLDGSDAAQPPANMSELSLNDWLRVNQALRGNAKESTESQRARLESIPLACFPVALAVNAKPACVGLGMLQDRDFGLFGIFTPEAERNRGYGTLVTQCLLTIARREKAQRAFLQVEEDNVAAQGIYAAMGFRSVYRYWYRIKRS